jgi:hypothetical protein
VTSCKGPSVVKLSGTDRQTFVLFIWTDGGVNATQPYNVRVIGCSVMGTVYCVVVLLCCNVVPCIVLYCCVVLMYRVLCRISVLYCTVYCVVLYCFVFLYCVLCCCTTALY